MRLIGIDYGEKNVGIAISDDKGMMAFPHGVIRNNAELVQHVVHLATEKGVKTIVIGDSVNYNGQPNRIMKDAQAFAEELQKQGLQTAFESELLSSHQAAHFLGKTDMIDASAASIILQSYIDRIKNA